MYKLSLRLTPEDSKELKDFAITNQKNNKFFTPNGKGRQFCILNKQDGAIKDLALKLWHETYNTLGITEYKEEPLFGIFLGVNNDGGFVHEHVDRAPDGFHHVRINYLISKPNVGGLPIVNNVKLDDIEEGGCWLNIANIWTHSSTPVVGDKDRIVLSLGALVPVKIIEERFLCKI